MLNRKLREAPNKRLPELLQFVDSLELPSVAEELAQSAAAGLPSGIWLVLDEVAVEEVRSLRFELLEAQRVGIEGTAGERRGELVGDKVADERVVVLLGLGIIRVADELELTILSGVVVELELYGRRIDMGSERQPVGVNTSLGALVAERDDVGWSSVEVEEARSDLVGGEEEVGSTGSVARWGTASKIISF